MGDFLQHADANNNRDVRQQSKLLVINLSTNPARKAITSTCINFFICTVERRIISTNLKVIKRTDYIKNI